MMGFTGIKQTLIVFAVFLACAVVAIWAASSEEVWQPLTLLSVAQIGVLLLLSLANYALRALRWFFTMKVLKTAGGIGTALRVYFGGFALTITPAKLGEIIRLRWLAREGGVRVETLAPLVLVDRAGDLASTAIVLAVALGAGTIGIASGLPVALMALVLALIATRPSLFKALTDITYRLIRRKARWFVRARRASRALGPFSSLRVILPVLALGALGWMAEGYAFYLLLDWMGASVGFWACISIFLFAMITGGATGVPGGVGGAEAAMIALLSLQSVPLEISIPATAIIRITTLWFAVALGFIVFPFAENHTTKVRNALENR